MYIFASLWICNLVTVYSFVLHDPYHKVVLKDADSYKVDLIITDEDFEMFNKKQLKGLKVFDKKYRHKFDALEEIVEPENKKALQRKIKIFRPTIKIPTTTTSTTTTSKTTKTTTKITTKPNPDQYDLEPDAPALSPDPDASKSSQDPDEPTTCPDTDTPTQSSDPDVPTPSPDIDTSTPCPDQDLPTPSPDPDLPTPSPDPDLSTPSPDQDLPTPSPDPDLSTPSPDQDLPTQSPDPDLPTPSPDLDLSTQSPDPDLPTPSPDTDTLTISSDPYDVNPNLNSRVTNIKEEDYSIISESSETTTVSIPILVITDKKYQVMTTYMGPFNKKRRVIPTQGETITEYDYDLLANEYYYQVSQEAKDNDTFHFKETATTGIPDYGALYSLKKMFSLRPANSNCTDKGIGPQAIICLMDNYNSQKLTIEEMTARSWNILKIWFLVYLAIALPFWCTRGWCCCCLCCKFCKPRQTIEEAKKFVIHYPPGTYKTKSGDIRYTPSEREKECYEEFEHFIKTL